MSATKSRPRARASKRSARTYLISDDMARMFVLVSDRDRAVCIVSVKRVRSGVFELTVSEARGPKKK